MLSCDDGQEESLKKLTSFLDKKYKELKEKLGNIGENKLLLITTIQLIDEYFDLKERVSLQKKKLDDLSKKFLELKSLLLWEKIALIDQYSWGLNFSISNSLSVIIRKATDWTRPADLDPGSLVHKIGDMLNPTK